MAMKGIQMGQETKKAFQKKNILVVIRASFKRKKERARECVRGTDFIWKIQ